MQNLARYISQAHNWLRRIADAIDDIPVILE